VLAEAAASPLIRLAIFPIRAEAACRERVRLTVMMATLVVGRSIF
jgi:hypothetical protein